MFSKHPWIAPALAAALAWSGSAAAQTAGNGAILSTGGIRVTPHTVAGADVNTLVGLYLGIAECESNAEVVFRLDNVIADKPSIDVYLGDRCNTADRKDTTVNSCKFITTLDKGTRTQDIDLTVMAADLFDGCTNNRSGKPNLWFLAVNTPEGTEVVAEQNFGVLEVNLDTQRPDAPTDVKGGSGERVISVDWKSEDVDLEGFKVYIDRAPVAGSGTVADDDGGTMPASSGDCTSSVLKPGEQAADIPSSIITKSVNEKTAQGVDLDPDDIGGAMAAVAVVAVDLAGNESPVSNIGCVKIVETESFWDRYQANGGDATGGCPCRTSAKAELKSAWPIALALLLLRRRAGRRAA